MVDESFKLTQEHVEAMEAIRNGADVGNRVIAMRLREIERERPELISIGELQGDYDGAGRLPYFGAILTDEGIHFLNSRAAEIAT